MGSWSETSRPQNCEKVHFCCVSHQVYMVFCYGSSSRWIEALSFLMGSPFLECELLIGRDPLCWWPCIPTSSLVLTDWTVRLSGNLWHGASLHPHYLAHQDPTASSPCRALSTSPTKFTCALGPERPWRRLSLRRACAECWFTSFSQRLGGLMSPLALVKCTPSPCPVPAAALLTARGRIYDKDSSD